MSKISELREIVIQYIAGNVDPDDIKTIKRFDEVLERLTFERVPLRST